MAGQTPALPYLEVLMRIRQGKLQDAQDSAGWIPRTDNQPTNKGTAFLTFTCFPFPQGTECSRSPGSPCALARPELYTPHTLPRPHSRHPSFQAGTLALHFPSPGGRRDKDHGSHCLTSAGCSSRELLRHWNPALGLLQGALLCPKSKRR